MDRQFARSFYLFMKHRIRSLDDYRRASLIECFHTPDVIKLHADQKLYALGDLHGDFEVMWYSLHAADLIDDNGDWTGNDSIVIQLGDMCDGARGVNRVPYAGERFIINFLKNLHLQAVEEGGMVITMLGNHDVHRLLATYDANGKIVYPNVPNNYYLKKTTQYGPDLNPGIDRSFGPRAAMFMSPDNETDFRKNQSLSQLDDPNQYLDEEHGFHRQLLASCASKLILKAEWTTRGGDETGIGILASHGEKNNRFMNRLRTFLIDQFTIIDRKYGLDFLRLIEFPDKPDNFLVTINSLFSFFLRKYRTIDIDDNTAHDEPFSHMMFNFLNMIGNNYNDNFLWCYVQITSPYGGMPGSEVNTCRSAAETMNSFGLNASKSICLSAHSGALSIPTRRIKVNRDGWCRGLADPVHENSIIMTDIMASRAFSRPVTPQIAEISFDGNGLTVGIISAADDVINLPAHHNRPELDQKKENPINLRLKELRGGSKRSRSRRTF